MGHGHGGAFLLWNLRDLHPPPAPVGPDAIRGESGLYRGHEPGRARADPMDRWHQSPVRPVEARQFFEEKLPGIFKNSRPRSGVADDLGEAVEHLLVRADHLAILKNV